jgi:gliding motility-associated-like protein
MFEGQSCEIVRYLPVNVDDCYSVFIANAFSPKGYNNIFKPIGQLEKVTDYVFRIFDRTGKELFSTQDPYSGWDGRFNGEFVPNGVYVYMLRFMPEYGTKGVEKFGSLLIVE